MKKMICISLAMFTVLGFTKVEAQDLKYDVLDQVGLIKTLIPEVKTVGIMVGPNDLETIKDALTQAQTQYGIKLVTVGVKDIKQKLAQYMKLAASGVVKNYGVEALLIVNGSDLVTKSPIGIKMTTSELVRSKIPTFSANEKGLKLGCLGQFSLSGDKWIMNMESDFAQTFGVKVPSQDSRFLVN